MAVSAVLIAGASFRYLAGGQMMIPPPLKPNFMDHAWAFYVHIAAGTTALAVGPWQFLAGWRRRAPVAHRLMGLTYVAACTVGGLAGMVIAPTSNGGPLAALLHEATGSWMPVFALVITCDLLTSLLAYVALKPLRRKYLATV